MRCAQCGLDMTSVRGDVCPRCGAMRTQAAPMDGQPVTTPLFGQEHQEYQWGAMSPGNPAYHAPTAASPQRQPRRVRLLLALSALLALVLLLTGGGLYLLSAQGRPGGTNNANGSTAASSTATANAQTTTATVASSPTATATTAPTATRAPTATPVPQLVTLIDDPLTSNINHWYTGSGFAFQNGGYEISSSGGGEVEAPLASLANANVAVDTKIAAANTLAYSFGMCVRVNNLSTPRSATQYCFLISGAGHWVVLSTSSNQYLAEGASSVIHQGIGASNAIEVDMSGSHFTFRVNGAQMVALTNSAYSSGGIALFTEFTGSDLSIDVVYNNFKVTQWR